MSDSGPPPKRRKLNQNTSTAPPTTPSNLSPEAAAAVARFKDKLDHTDKDSDRSVCSLIVAQVSGMHFRHEGISSGSGPVSCQELFVRGVPLFPRASSRVFLIRPVATAWSVVCRDGELPELIQTREKRRIVTEVLVSVADLPPTINMSQLHRQLKPVPDMNSGASQDEIERAVAENKAAVREAKRQNDEVDWAVQAALDRLQDFYEDTPNPAERARRVHENWNRQFQRMQRNLWRCCS
ncbi:hypothetical protein QBC37DRAFT_398890 [Rhypophila decipiens]|uniref:Uncharacterized protein n=1 Tax=Rhypophila decipiens TaxID=261697 RepID=A0AAN6YAN7_9PEZI|nr:hypothetical protein QBC37DRAFT_398890 [Rhypophila decipiens]